MGVEIKLKRQPQIHRAIVIDSLLNSIEYEIEEEGKAEDILELIIDIRNTAESIIELLIPSAQPEQPSEIQDIEENRMDNLISRQVAIDVRRDENV